MKYYSKECQKAWPNKFLLVSSFCFNSETCLTTISTKQIQQRQKQQPIIEILNSVIFKLQNEMVT